YFRRALDALHCAERWGDIAQLDLGQFLLQVDVVLDGHDSGEPDNPDGPRGDLLLAQHVHELLPHGRLAGHAVHGAGEVDGTVLGNEVPQPEIAGELLITIAEDQRGRPVGQHNRVARHGVQVQARDVVDVAVRSDLAAAAQDEGLQAFALDHRVQPGPAILQDS